MFPPLKRHAIQVLVAAGRMQHVEIARLLGVDERTVRRVAKESPVTEMDFVAPSRARIGRPSKAEPYRQFIADVFAAEPGLLSVEILRRARLAGYAGGKSALYELIAPLRPRAAPVEMRFEGLPGEFSQHDFGQVEVEFADRSKKRVHFFASRLKWSRWAEVTIVPDQTAETLIRTLADQFVAFGGVPLCAVFDRPKTVALSWKKNGEVTEWNPIFAYAALEIGFTAEVCWPYQPRQKGAVESLVKWVKGSFFTQRRFHDEEDLRAQLREWLRETNTERPSRPTGVIPAARIEDERARLRAVRVQPADLALRLPVSVGPTAEVVHEAHSYSMPPEAAGLPGTLYLYRHSVRIVAGRHEARHPRQRGRGIPSRLPEHRAAHLAAVAGARGKRYLKRQHLFDTGEAALRFLTEIVHRHPGGAWARDVDALHDLLQQVGPEAINRAFRAALDVGRISTAFVAECLGRPSSPPSLFPAEVSG